MITYITYELAKELKEAGFPHSEEWKDYNTYFSYTCDGIAEPTLSELIEACGNKFGQIVAFHDINGNIYLWEACSALQMKIKTGEGASPEEAVAKLWLALNKKSPN